MRRGYPTSHSRSVFPAHPFLLVYAPTVWGKLQIQHVGAASRLNWESDRSIRLGW